MLPLAAMEVNVEQERLSRCGQCGRMKGEALADDGFGPPVYAKVLCLCEGIVCRYCRQGALPKPISSRYDEETGRVLHVPHFTYLRRCDVCKERAAADALREIALRLVRNGCVRLRDGGKWADAEVTAKDFSDLAHALGVPEAAEP